MKNIRTASPQIARPLAPVAVLLVLAVTTHALLVGCGGKSQEGTGSSSTGAPQPAPAAQGAADTAGGGGDQVAIGAKVYKDRCALCHGPEGKGDGPAAAALNPKPRNHTDGAYMSSQTDEQLLQVIKSGKGGMPAWGSVLSDQEVRAVLQYVRTLAK